MGSIALSLWVPQVKLHDLDLEECLLAALLLHDDFAALRHFTDDDLWYDHLRPFISTIRRLHAAGKPSGAVFVLHALESQLDSLEWRGNRGEALLMDLLGRRMFDVQTFHGVSLGMLIHNYALMRKALRRAQSEGARLYQERVDGALKLRGWML